MKEYGLDEVIKTLKQRRKEQNLTLEEVSNRLNIRTKYLRALENGDDKDMPGEVYMQGYIKMYARHLAVDLGDFNLNNTRVAAAKLSSDNPSTSKSQMPGKYIIIASLVGLLSLGWLYQYLYSSEYRPKLISGYSQVEKLRD